MSESLLSVAYSLVKVLSLSGGHPGGLAPPCSTVRGGGVAGRVALPFIARLVFAKCL